MFDEPMSAMQFVGIGLLLISAYLLVGYSKKLTGSFTKKTLLLLLGGMLSNGLIMIAQKMFSEIPARRQRLGIFVSVVRTCGLTMLILLLPQLINKEGREKFASLPAAAWGYGAVLSVALLIINQLATLAGRVIPSAIMFPINDGGGTIIAALTASVCFGEKLTMRSVAGLALGIVSLIIINLC